MNRKQRLEEMSAAMRARQRRRCVPWTEEQIDYVRQHAASTPRAEMCAHLDRAPRTLSKMLKQLGLDGLRRPAPWSERDTGILREMAGKAPKRAIVAATGHDWYTVQKHAEALGIDLRFEQWWPPQKVQQLRDLAASGRTRGQIAAEMGLTKQTLSRAVSVFQVVTVREISNQYVSKTVAHDKLPYPRIAKPPKAEKPPRVREGLPVAIRRSVTIHGSVRYCDRCYAPVVDTPPSWAEHNLRLHVQPIRRIA